MICGIFCKIIVLHTFMMCEKESWLLSWNCRCFLWQFAPILREIINLHLHLPFSPSFKICIWFTIVKSTHLWQLTIIIILTLQLEKVRRLSEMWLIWIVRMGKVWFLKGSAMLNKKLDCILHAKRYLFSNWQDVVRFCILLAGFYFNILWFFFF